MKKCICLILSVIMLLTLCACGSNNGSETDSTTGMSQQNTPVTNQPGVVNDDTPDNKPAQPTAQAYTLSEYLSSGETIWFQMDADKGKDSKVIWIYVFEPDGTMYCTGVSYTLGELEQMDDTEIVEMAKQDYMNDVAIGHSHRHFVQMSKEEVIRSIFDIIYFAADPDVDMFTGEVTAKTKESITEGIKRNDHNLSSVYLVDEIIAHVDQIDLVTQSINGLASKMGQCSEFKIKDESDPLLKNCFDLAYFDALASFYVTCYEIPEDHYLRATIDYIASVGFEEELKAIETATAGLYDLAEEIYNDTVKRIEDSKALVQPGQYCLSIVSDSTGNNTLSMKLHYQYISDIATMETRIGSLTLDVIIPADVGGNTCETVVYDSIYGGYVVNDDVFYTRAVQGMELNLDQIGESDLPIDVKESESLFD